MAFTYALSSLVCACLTPLLIDAKRTGAPIEACVSMEPDHGNLKAQSGVLYTLDISAATYTPGTSITITIGPKDTNFQGFFVQVRKKGTKTIVGVFEKPDEGKLRECQNAGDSVTHKDVTNKKNLVLTWNPPKCNEGALEIKATVATDYSTWYVITEVPLAFKAAPMIKPDKLCPDMNEEAKDLCPGPATKFIEKCPCNVTCGLGTLLEYWTCDKDNAQSELVFSRRCCDKPCPGGDKCDVEPNDRKKGTCTNEPTGSQSCKPDDCCYATNTSHCFEPKPPPAITCAMVLPQCKQ